MTNEPAMPAAQQEDAVSVTRHRLMWPSVAAGIWALWYAAYRGYYAAGGTAFLPGTIRPGAEGRFQLINLLGAVIIAAAAVVPIATLPLWSRRWPRRMLLAVYWIAAVGCCMHALVDIAQRVLSLTGAVHIDYPPLWSTIDRRSADLQAIFFNEPWFLVQGLAFGTLCWIGLGPGRARQWWAATAVAAVVALFLLGMLTVAGILDKVIVF
ncbi:hypothetical protein [Micromonospora sp. NBC_00617]|uniref:hypothetical protein n=1 Tax=Micromonospora sp. NBC_00617 TaxID=2903587 RepID=UPI0030DF8926